MAETQDTLMETIIFVILNLIFFAALLFFVVRTSSASAATEEVYAKKIALIIDNMQPNMEVTVSLQDLFIQIDKNKFRGKGVPVEIVQYKSGTNAKAITVKTSSTSGYSYPFFSSLDARVDINEQDKILRIKT